MVYCVGCREDRVYFISTVFFSYDSVRFDSLGAFSYLLPDYEFVAPAPAPLIDFVVCLWLPFFFSLSSFTFFVCFFCLFFCHFFSVLFTWFVCFFVALTLALFFPL